jgi:hypothetical protein
MRHVLRAGTELKHGKNLREGINGQPQPEHLCGAAQPGAQFVQLEVGDLEIAETVLVQGLSVLTSARQPESDSSLTIAEDPFGGGRIEPFGQRREHHRDLGRGGFQAIQGGVASGSEGGLASLTTKRLDPLSLAMSAISDQGVDVRVCDPGVRALRVGTSEALSVDRSDELPGGFSLRARVAQAEALVPQQMHGRRRGDRQGSPEGCGA